MTKDEVRRLFENVTDQELHERRKMYMTQIWKLCANKFISLANSRDGESFMLGDVVTEDRVIDALDDEILKIMGDDYTRILNKLESVVYNRTI